MKLLVHSETEVPGDKSLSHRALLLAAVARGESRLRGVLPGADCRSTAAVLRSLGCPIPELRPDAGELRVESAGISGWRQPDTQLDCGNSGTTARLLLGLLASRPFCSKLSGDDSLRARPMARVTEPLARMGASFHDLGEKGRLPLEVCGGPLAPLEYRSPHASAQIKSAILLAGLGGNVPVRVHEPARSRDHTERLLASLGVPITTATTEQGWEITMNPAGEPLPPLDLTVPGDISSAAFLVALALLAEGGELRVRRVGLNPTRIGLLPILARMGAQIRIEAEHTVHGEPVGDLLVTPSALRATEITQEEIPSAIDEIPIIAALATRAEGTTRVTGAAELRVKESDRLAVLVSNLRAVGARAEELPDGLTVTGTEAPIAGWVQTHGDHRIAMAFGVLAALPGNRIQIDYPECVDVSFPGFWEMLRSVTSA